MKILIDIGHPAHVHYFKHFIRLMKEKGHEFLIIAKDRNVTLELLEYYRLPYIKRKNYPKSLLGKLINIPFTDLKVIKLALSFKPDILLGFSGTHIAHAGYLLRRPSVVIDDTEHAKLAHASYKPFASIILTPDWFNKNMGNNHLRFDSYMELCALHPEYFTPDESVRSLLGLNESEEYIILRFVSWSASHDVGQSGLTLESKRSIVERYKDKFRIFISAEKEIPPDLEQYRLKVPAAKLHDVLAFAKLHIGEGSTTASECAVLGTPAIYINSLVVGNCKEEEEIYNLCYNYTTPEGFLDKADEILSMHNSKLFYAANRKKLIEDKINPTAFLIWFFQEYPESVRVLKKNPEYQKIFR